MLSLLLRRDLTIRLAGLLIATPAVASLWAWFGSQIAVIGSTDVAVAGVGFVAIAGGLTLASLGSHVHDRVSVARPWGTAFAFEHSAAVRSAAPLVPSATLPLKDARLEAAELLSLR